MTRIKEKMFFGKSDKQKKDMRGSIQQILQRQEIGYQHLVDDILESATQVSFNITDMLRGKCVFLNISDIIQTLKEIKRFAAKNDDIYHIQSADSRFTNKVPISDVTMKISIKKKVVAQLQLTIQTNAAAYNFAHKIYQLQRTKVFSKLKIVHNYFEEYCEEFNEVTSKALGLLQKQGRIGSKLAKTTQRYFRLRTEDKRYFPFTLAESAEQKSTTVSLLRNTIDPSLQGLLTGVYCIATKVWYKTLGQKINATLKDESLPKKLKSVLVSQFLDEIDLPKESDLTHQNGLFPFEAKSKIFMNQSIKENFQIENVFEYEKENQRVFHRATHLKEILFQKSVNEDYIQVRQGRFVINNVIQTHSSMNITRLIEMLNFYFVTRDDEFFTIYSESFDHFYNYIIKLLIKHKKEVDADGLLEAEVNLVRAQQRLQSQKPEIFLTANDLLTKTIEIFKKNQKQDKVLMCQMLKFQCSNRYKNTQGKDVFSKAFLENMIKQQYIPIVNKAETLGIPMQGPIYAESMWRLFMNLYKFTMENGKKTLLQQFGKPSIIQMSKYQGKKLIYDLIYMGQQFKQNGVKLDQLAANQKLTFLRLNNIRDSACQTLCMANTCFVTKLNLAGNDLTSIGCQYLSKGKWMNLVHINLSNNNIGPKGCKYLANGSWKNLQEINLSNSNVQYDGIKFLTDSSLDITKINLANNKIGTKGCQLLGDSNWKNLNYLNLQNNNIGTIACQALANAGWINMAKLNLNLNTITSQGCQLLSKADWPNLIQLHLKNNGIDFQGPKSIANANWNNLTILNLDCNQIQDKGCLYLAKGDWKNLINLSLRQNRIELQGVLYLIRGKWYHLKKLNLGQYQDKDHKESKDVDFQDIEQQKRKELQIKFTQNTLSISWTNRQQHREKQKPAKPAKPKEYQQRKAVFDPKRKYS